MALYLALNRGGKKKKKRKRKEQKQGRKSTKSKKEKEKRNRFFSQLPEGSILLFIHWFAFLVLIKPLSGAACLFLRPFLSIIIIAIIIISFYFSFVFCSPFTCHPFNFSHRYKPFRFGFLFRILMWSYLTQYNYFAWKRNACSLYSTKLVSSGKFGPVLLIVQADEIVVSEFSLWILSKVSSLQYPLPPKKKKKKRKKSSLIWKLEWTCNLEC